MAGQGLDAVTGAFGFTSRSIAHRLLGDGRAVRTLTNHPDASDPLYHSLEVAPLDFGRPAQLARDLRGVDTLYNTYWVRLDRGTISFDRAVVESAALFTAAREAGVRRIVHISVANADEESPLPYFRGKGRVERALRESGVSYAVVRPTVIVGERDVLIHDIAWLLRRLPVFGIAGDGSYRIQPVIVDDVVRLARDAAAGEDAVTIDAVGPETFTYLELVRVIRDAIGSRARLVRMPPFAILAGAALLGPLVRDVVLTRDELRGLMGEVLISSSPPTGRIPFTDWLRANRQDLGRRYANELTLHYSRPK